MNTDKIERYGIFNTKGCPDELIFGDFNEQPIPSNYFNLLNDDDDNDTNFPGNIVNNELPENKEVEDAVMPNDEYFYNDIIIYDDDILASDIYPLQNEMMKIEGVENQNEGREIEGMDNENKGVDSEN